MKLSPTASAVAALCVVLGLTGCTSSESDLTLAETKFPTQLLRNEAADRLLKGTDDIVAGQQDFSAACKEESEDPGGLYRAWWSTLASRVPEDSAIGVEQFVGALATSFAQDGWQLKEVHESDDSTVLKVTKLTKSSSPVTLTITAADGSNAGASIYIEAEGPCVLTGGPESDEVTALER
jgi:hypothetical protein